MKNGLSIVLLWTAINRDVIGETYGYCNNFIYL